MQINKTILSGFLIVTTITTFAQTAPAADSAAAAGIVDNVEEEAAFIGGETAWRDYLSKNLNANVPVDNGAPVGKYTVYVQFIVDKSGGISDVKALTSLGYGMEREVVRIIRKSGTWNPATINKQPVKAYRKQPVTFQVMQDGLDIISEVPFMLFQGVDNELTIDVRKVKPEDLNVTISRGTIRMTKDGKFIARVNNPGRVIVGVSGKRNKKIADISFEVREKAQ